MWLSSTESTTPSEVRTSGSLALESLAVVGVVIVVRMVWMFGATAMPGGQRLFGATEANARSWRETTVVGWAGMRGAVSLAAALALPQDFPQRDLIIFLTFGVIVATMTLIVSILFSIAVVRLLDVYAFRGRVWASDAVVGGLLTVAGLVAWTKRRGAGAP